MSSRIPVNRSTIEAVTMLAYKLGKEELCLELLNLLKTNFSKGEAYEMEYKPMPQKGKHLKLLGAGEVPGPDVGQLS